MKYITEIRHRFALLIGVQDYVDTSFKPLPQTVPDVTALAEVLERSGYTVNVLHSEQPEPAKQPTKANIWAELKSIARITEPGDLMLIHFGGHGLTDGPGAAYLIPSDGRKAALAETAIDLYDFKETVLKAGAQARILFLDACHSGIGRDATGMLPDFEETLFLQANGAAILAACRRGEVAYNHDASAHGVFTHYLLEGLKGAAVGKSKRFITFDDIKDYVTHHVKRWAYLNGKHQWPNAKTRVMGDPPIIDLELSTPNTAPHLMPHIAGAAPAHSIPNPFNEILAIRDPQRFIGRQSELRRLNMLLQGGSVALLGEPRIGKSSLLWQLARQWKHKTIGPLNIDQLENREGFYRFLATALELDNAGWSAINSVLQKQKALLLLDELDNSPNRGLTHRDFAHLRALCEDNRDFKIVAVTRTPLKEIYPDTGQGSPFFNYLQPLSLGPLRQEDVMQLLAHPWSPEGLQFQPQMCEQIIATAGRHPFKLQRAAFHCYQSLLDPTYFWHSAFQQDMEHML